MNWLKENVALLRRNNRLWVACFVAAVSVYCFVFAVIEPRLQIKIVDVFFGLLNLAMILDMVGISKKDEHEASMKKQLADCMDENAMLRSKVFNLQDELSIYEATKGNSPENPIKSNRIVSDKTFALRLRLFVEDVRCNDPMSEEEAGYLSRVAERLLKWQTKTVRKDSSEYAFLQLNGLMPEPSKNTEEHTESKSEETNPKRKTAPRRKQKNGTTENENKD